MNLHELLRLKFKRGNSIEIDQVVVKRKEYEAALASELSLNLFATQEGDCDQVSSATGDELTARLNTALNA